MEKDYKIQHAGDADPHVRIPFASRLGLQAQVLQGRVRQATRELQGLYP